MSRKRSKLGQIEEKTSRMKGRRSTEKKEEEVYTISSLDHHEECEITAK